MRLSPLPSKASDQAVTAGRSLFSTGEIHELNSLASIILKRELEKCTQSPQENSLTLEGCSYLTGSILLGMSKLNINVKFFSSNSPPKQMDTLDQERGPKSTQKERNPFYPKNTSISLAFKSLIIPLLLLFIFTLAHLNINMIATLMCINL